MKMISINITNQPDVLRSVGCRDLLVHRRQRRRVRPVVQGHVWGETKNKFFNYFLRYLDPDLSLKKCKIQENHGLSVFNCFCLV